jgi:hypothetical protein
MCPPKIGRPNYQLAWVGEYVVHLLDGSSVRLSNRSQSIRLL